MDADVGEGSGSSEYLGLGRSGAGGLIVAAVGEAASIGVTAIASVGAACGLDAEGGVTSGWAATLGASGLTHTDSPVAELT